MRSTTPYRKTSRGFLFFCIAAEVVKAVLFVLVPIWFGAFIDVLVTDSGEPIMLFCLLAGTAGAYWLLALAVRYLVQRYGRQQERHLRNQLLDHLCLMPLLKIDGYAQGELMMKFFRDVEAWGGYLHTFIPQFLAAVFSILAALIMVLMKNELIALLYLVLVPFLVMLLLPYKKLFTRLNHSMRRLYDRTLNRLFEFAHIFPYLKSMSAEAPYRNATGCRFERIRQVCWKNDCGQLSFEAVNRLVLYLGEYGILAVAGYLAWKKQIPVGDVVVFQVLFLSVLNAVSGLFQMLPMWETIRESQKSLDELFAVPAVSDSQNAIPLSGPVEMVALQNISFTYTPDRPLFQNYSCQIKRGAITAISGVNGSGKTTLLRLLTGYLEPQLGTVRINGNPLAHWLLESFRKRVAAVFQDSLLITGTIRDNITLKNSTYTEDAITEALQLSGADALVERLPDGLNHKIGVEGGGLSGGERQKIAIARALIRKPDILIFDEVTNHLDYESRMRMKTLLQRLRGHTTVLLVSHDPEILALCEQEIHLNLY